MALNAMYGGVNGGIWGDPLGGMKAGGQVDPAMRPRPGYRVRGSGAGPMTQVGSGLPQLPTDAGGGFYPDMTSALTNMPGGGYGNKVSTGAPMGGGSGLPLGMGGPMSGGQSGFGNLQ